MKKKVLLLINPPGKQAGEDELDVLVQAGFIEESLKELGYATSRLFFDMNLQKMERELLARRPCLVFNLVEAVGGKGQLIFLAPALLEALQIPFTGSGSYAMLLSTDKIRAKKHMKQLGIPTPEWHVFSGGDKPFPGKKYIIKPVSEDGSVGIDDHSVAFGREIQAGEKGAAWFMEEYLPGREFNLSVLGGEKDPRVLPPAEMQFLSFPEGKPRILNYASKWDENSFEYQHTQRSFSVQEEDKALLEEMKRISLRCWEAFDTKGYIRVDFRTDAQNQPRVIEVNANPCISPDAGFPAACKQAGIGYTEMIENILKEV